MQILYQSVKIDFLATGSTEILQNLRTLYTTPEGTVVFDRKFGINTNILDQPLPIARGKLVQEYTEKTRRYEPRAIVREVLFDEDNKEGKLIPRVVIDFVE